MHRGKSIRTCEKCGDYHDVKDTRPLPSGTIRRSLVCSACGHREYSFEVKVKKIPGEPLKKRDIALLKAMEKVR